MKKCTVWTAAVVAALVALCSFTSLGSYLYLAYHKASGIVYNAVPPEVEIDRLKLEVSRIDGDVQKAFGPIAEQQVAVENLKKEVANGRVNLDTKKKNLMTMKTDLESGTRTVNYGGKDYSADAIRAKLSRDFETYKVSEQALKQKEALLEAKTKAVDAALQQLKEMQAQRDQLQVELARMEAELQTVRVAETQSKIQLDDSRLAHINASMKALNDRIEAEKKEVTLQQTFVNPDSIPVEQKTRQADVLKDVDDYFGKAPADKVAEQK